MDTPTNLYEDPDTIDPVAVVLSRRNERMLKGAVSQRYNIPPTELTVLHEIAIRSKDQPRRYDFVVVHNNVYYGVAATENESQLVDFNTTILF